MTTESGGPADTADVPNEDAPRRALRAGTRLGGNVVALAAVSFFTDVSSEMIYPLLPLFLTGTIGASGATVGAIEGAAESTAALLKLASGWWSDHRARRKPLVLVGYGIASVARPLVALAGAAGQVLAIRLADRVGKGIRSSPRDALIADSVDAAVRGRAFGFHRAADHAGAVVGPLVAFALLGWAEVPLRVVFGLAAVPAAAAMVVLALAVKEPASRRGAGVPPRLHDRSPKRLGHHPGDAGRGESSQGESSRSTARRSGSPRDASNARAADARSSPLPGRFWAFLGAVLVFTLGNSTDAFLLLRAAHLGVAPSLIPVLWAVLHVVKSAASTPGGALSDRVGRKPLIVGGWLLYALVYVGFAVATRAWHAWALFAVYGVFFGMTEGAEKALVSDIVGVGARGRAFGWYNLAVGIGAFPASLLFGLLWDRGGPEAAFMAGAALALVASVLAAGAAPGRADLPSAA